MAAAAIKALNARIRSNPWTDYFFSTRERFSPLPPGSPTPPLRSRPLLARIAPLARRETDTPAGMERSLGERQKACKVWLIG
jgi:hypothetical protein